MTTRRGGPWWTPIVLTALVAGGCASGAGRPTEPRVSGPWWQVAGNPDLGPLTGPPADLPEGRQEPVDFAMWQAGDGTWQLWSCIRATRCGGQTRLLYGWESPSLTRPDWTPTGIRMQADPDLGETPGGLQAPHVVRDGDTWVMAYGDWVNICIQRSTDGKNFLREPGPDGRSGRFGEGEGANTRDPMLIRIDGRWHCYYTACPGGVGAVYCRTSPDLLSWSEARIVSRGGLTGSGPWSSECPHVVRVGGHYYLFRTQQYRHPPVTAVYRSTDPMDFGVDHDRCLVGLLPVAAPEIVSDGRRQYLAALMPDIQGIRLAPLEWTTIRNGSEQ